MEYDTHPIVLLISYRKNIVVLDIKKRTIEKVDYSKIHHSSHPHNMYIHKATTNAKRFSLLEINIVQFPHH